MCQTRIRLHDSPGYSHSNGPWYFRPWKCAICSYCIASREPKFSLPKRELIPFLIRGSVFLFLSQMSSTGDAVPPQSLPCINSTRRVRAYVCASASSFVFPFRSLGVYGRCTLVGETRSQTEVTATVRFLAGRLRG